MFVYHNVEPAGYHLSDCVIRAISTALDIPYYEVVNMLANNGKFYECDAICIDCYGKLLTHDLKLPHYIGRNTPVKDLAEDFSDHILLVRVSGHLTCTMYGDVYDTWDCSDKLCTDFWVVE